jgi:hypothetical protein
VAKATVRALEDAVVAQEAQGSSERVGVHATPRSELRLTGRRVADVAGDAELGEDVQAGKGTTALVSVQIVSCG